MFHTGLTWVDVHVQALQALLVAYPSFTYMALPSLTCHGVLRQVPRGVFGQADKSLGFKV